MEGDNMTYISVSYTHLDVYKRQVQNFSPHPRIIWRETVVYCQCVAGCFVCVCLLHYRVFKSVLSFLLLKSKFE